MQKSTTRDPLAMRRSARGSAQAGKSVADANCDADFALWLDRQLAMLRARNFGSVDRDHLIEELESMGKSDGRELASRLETLLMHLSKCEFQLEMKSGRWKSTRLEQRARIGDLLEDSPSLRGRVASSIAERLPIAVGRAALETGVSAASFPTDCNYTVEQVLDLDFIP